MSQPVPTPPRLSVIIPSRDGLETLPRAVASVLAMNVAAMEVIVVDDGSTDGTAAWLAELSARDPRVTSLRRDANHGVAAARNAGIAAARAPLLGFLDADDVWFPEAIERRLAWHETHPQTILSFAEHRTLLPDGTQQEKWSGYCPRYRRFRAARPGILPLGTQAFGLLAGENPVCTSSVMASRAAVLFAGGFDASLRQAEDWDLWIRLARQGDVAASGDVELLHADRPGSLSHKVAERVACMRQVVRRHRPAVLRRAPGAALAATSLLAQAEVELAARQGRNGRAFRQSLLAAACQPSTRAMRDAMRAGLVIAGLKPPMKLSHA
jgi:glycosyltransferase involved in cell wall biosynthesis